MLSPNCSGSIIQGEERIIAAVGLKDLIVVDTRDALLVCDKSQAQEVKKLVELLKTKNIWSIHMLSDCLFFAVGETE